jgi:hypothetical protein
MFVVVFMIFNNLEILKPFKYLVFNILFCGFKLSFSDSTHQNQH